MNSKYIARSSAIAARKLGDEMIIMSALNSTLFTLNPVATVIWQAADGRTPLSEIVVQLSGTSSSEIILNVLPAASASLIRATVGAVLLLRLA